jgi:hypothetical protein
MLPDSGLEGEYRFGTCSTRTALGIHPAMVCGRML